MSDVHALVLELSDGRRRFLELVADIRPDLHRYCARMTGSVAEGEDIVQETLARAYYVLPEMHSLPPLRSWLFQIAHRRALDHLRRYDRRKGQPLDDDTENRLPAPSENAEDALSRQETVQAAFSAFMALPPLPRSCVILKDVLGHSVDEIASLLELGPAAVKAAIHRGRVRLRSQGAPRQPSRVVGAGSPTIARYVALFNARDWDGVRALLANDVRLDLVSKSQRSGRRDVSGYLTNYDSFHDWFLVPAWIDDREVVAAFRDQRDQRPSYFIELVVTEGLVSSIRDFRYVPYIVADAAIEVAPGAR
jgi:RNA polymerase sigma-70 factor (ECF subfamily)